MDQDMKGIILVFALLITFVVISLFFGLPMWNVWRQGLSGEAKLKYAIQERQILVTQAEAEREAAKARADAIAIVGAAAKAYPEYRTQEFIGAFAEAIKAGSIHQIIYVPTEANIPITEAHRLQKEK